MKREKAFLRAAAVLLLGVAAGCAKDSQTKEPPTPVTVAAATLTTVPYSLPANGVVEPVQTVAVQPQVSGQIVEVAFHEGDEVHKGQVLFRIDPRPFQAALRQAEAALARDQAQATNAAREAERYDALVDKGYVTKSQADQLKATAAAQAAVVEADRAAVEAARLDLGYATIRAPIDGRTGSLLVKVGNQVRVPNATPLVVINQLHPVLVRFTVPARTLSELQRVLRAGDAPRVHVAPTGADSSHLSLAEVGTLDFVDNAVDTTTGAITLKARFPNSSGALWPGQFLNVTLDLYEQRNAVTVPAVAVETGQEGSYVYVIDQSGHAQMKPVTVSRTVGEVAVISSGVEAGTRVVTDGQSRLYPGAQVVVRSAGGPASMGTARASAVAGDSPVRS